MPLNHSSKYAQLTDKQFELVGKLTIEFSNIEFLLSQILSRLMLTSPFLGRTFTDRLGAIKLIDKIQNAIDIHCKRYHNRIISVDATKDLSDVLSKISKIRLIRNKFAHYCWMRHSDESIFGTSFSSKQPNPKKADNDSISLKNTEIIEFYNQSTECVNLLENLLSRLPEISEEELLRKSDE